MNSSGDVLVVWDRDASIGGAILADGTWTSLPPLTTETSSPWVDHVRLFDDGSGVVVTSGSVGGNPPATDLQIHTLADGAWTTRTMHPPAGRGFTFVADAATSPDGDLLVWWAEYPVSQPGPNSDLETAGSGATIYAAVQLAGEETLGTPQVISKKPSCFVYGTCSTGTFLDGGGAVLTYAETVGGDQVRKSRRYDPVAGTWTDASQMLPAGKSSDVDIRDDGQAFAYLVSTTGEKQMYDCPTVESCVRVADLEGFNRTWISELLARPRGGALAYTAKNVCPLEDCSYGQLQATVLRPSFGG